MNDTKDHIPSSDVEKKDHDEYQYLELIEKIFQKGTKKADRTSKEVFS